MNKYIVEDKSDGSFTGFESLPEAEQEVLELNDSSAIIHTVAGAFSCSVDVGQSGHGDSHTFFEFWDDESKDKAEEGALVMAKEEITKVAKEWKVSVIEYDAEGTAVDFTSMGL